MPSETAELKSSERKIKIQKLWKEKETAIREIFNMFHRKGVKRILKLTVKDNAEYPCSDDTIESCLSGFDVRYMDWQKPDLCAEVVLSEAPNVVELTLHSSGNNAVLQSWASETSICDLNKVRQDGQLFSVHY